MIQIRMIKRLFALTLCFLIQLSLLSSLALAREKMASSQPSQAAFDKLVDEYLISTFNSIPRKAHRPACTNTTRSWKTSLAPELMRRSPDCSSFRKSLIRSHLRTYPPESAGDLEVLTSSIQARLLELLSIQMWRKRSRYLRLGPELQRLHDYAPEFCATGRPAAVRNSA